MDETAMFRLSVKEMVNKKKRTTTYPDPFVFIAEAGAFVSFGRIQ